MSIRQVGVHDMPHYEGSVAVHERVYNTVPQWVRDPDLADAMRFVIACPGTSVRIERPRSCTAYSPSGSLVLRGVHAQHTTWRGRDQWLVVFETGVGLMPRNNIDMFVKIGSVFKRRQSAFGEDGPAPLVARNDTFVDANLTLQCADLARAMRTRDAAEACIKSIPGFRDLAALALAYVDFASDVFVWLAPAGQ